MNHEPQMSGEKTCSRCKKTKHVLAFSVARNSSDGLRSQCRDCINEYNNRKWHRRSRLKGTLGTNKARGLKFKIQNEVAE